MARTAIVIGAGIGGLSAAIGLRRTGWQVTVLERVAALRPVGAGLVLQANGLRCLDALGVSASVRERGRPDASGGTRRSDGRWLARVEASEMERRLGTTAVGIHRAALHEVLLGALPAATVLTGAHVTAVTPDGDVAYEHAAARSGRPLTLSSVPTGSTAQCADCSGRRQRPRSTSA